MPENRGESPLQRSNKLSVTARPAYEPPATKTRVAFWATLRDDILYSTRRRIRKEAYVLKNGFNLAYFYSPNTSRRGVV